MITKRQCGLAMPDALQSGRLAQWYDALVAAMTSCQITTDNRISFFMANISEETGQLKAMSENLNYSASRLRQLFPTIFDAKANADTVVAGGQELIANTIFSDQFRDPAHRLGNNMPGDGFKYRGRGPMQTTGKGNYLAYFHRVGLPNDSDPDLLLQPTHGALSAATFWQDHGCNAFADAGDFTSVVVRVNGGTINLETRQDCLQRFTQAMAQPDPAPVPTA